MKNDLNLAIFFNLSPGGAKRVLYEQVKGLIKRHKIDIYTLSSANHDFCDLRTLSSNYYIYPGGDSLPPAMWNSSASVVSKRFPKSVLDIYTRLPEIHKKIAEDIDKKGYDALLVHPDFYTQAPYILRYLKTPTLYYCHEIRREFYETIPRVAKRKTYYLTLPFRYPIKIIDLQNISKASLILVNSHFTQESVQKYYHLSSRVNYPPIDFNLFKRDPNIQKENIVLSVGGFNLLKGHDLTIKSIARIPENIRPKFILAGSGGEDKEYILRLAHEHKVDMTVITNPSDKALVNWYNRAKVFIYSPHNEPFGLSPLESLSSGTPVVSVNEGGVTEILKYINMAHLVERNESDMSTKIIQLLAKPIRFTDYIQSQRVLHQKINKSNSVKELESYIKSICL